MMRMLVAVVTITKIVIMMLPAAVMTVAVMQMTVAILTVVVIMMMVAVMTMTVADMMRTAMVLTNLRTRCEGGAIRRLLVVPDRSLTTPLPFPYHVLTKFIARCEGSHLAVAGGSISLLDHFLSYPLPFPCQVDRGAEVY